VRDLLEETLATGVSISDEDVVLGVATVAAPTLDHRGKARAAIAFNLLPDVLRSDRDSWAELARSAALDASHRFGYAPSTVSSTK